MADLFLDVLNLSITASYLIVAVILARLLLRKAPKNVRCLLWLFVGLRLVFPFSIESVFSLIPNQDAVRETVLYDLQSDAETVNMIPYDSEGTVIPAPDGADSGAGSATKKQNAAALAVDIASKVWVAGIGALALYLVVSWYRLRRKVRTAVPCVCGDIKYYQCDTIPSPFLFGLARPKIYVPADLSADEEELMYVLWHEQTHRRRKDYVIKPIAYLLLTVYWFNPLVWAAYILLCRDIELACDERVIKELGDGHRKEYSQALLNCSVSHRTIAACPVAFGEIGVKQRVKNVLNYKKPTFWVIVAAAAACVVIAVCFMTQRSVEEPSEVTEDNISDEALTKLAVSSVFTLYLPEELAGKLTYEAKSDREVVLMTTDREYELGTLYAAPAADILQNLEGTQFRLIGNYGVNEELKNYCISMSKNIKTAEAEIPIDENEGIIAIPNADGTDLPENLPNAGEKFQTETVSGSEKTTRELLADLKTVENLYCYIFIPYSGWDSDKDEELAEIVQLQNEFVACLDDIEVVELAQAEPADVESDTGSIEDAIAETEAQAAELQKELESVRELLEFTTDAAQQAELTKQVEAITKKQEELEARIQALKAERERLSSESAGHQSKAYAFVVTWAQAFCGRDGAALIKMAGPEAEAQMADTLGLAGGIDKAGKSYVSFGWSSPWPWGDDADYQIVSATDTSAVILYYAWTSDPHITVWREDITYTYEAENDAFTVTSESTRWYDAICVAEEFYRAYPNGIINGTRMDYYAENGAGEALNRNAKNNRTSSSHTYNLFSPETAAVNLLNILHNENKVKTDVEYTNDEQTQARVTFTFTEDNSTASVMMIKPYGDDGIWLPQTDEDAVERMSMPVYYETLYTADNILERYAQDGAVLAKYFPNHHELQAADTIEDLDIDGDGIYEPTHVITEAADLNGDGENETIRMADLKYNGGDGGYEISVESGGKALAMPDGYTRDGFGFYTKYDSSTGKDDMPDGKDVVLNVYTQNGQILASFTRDALFELYDKKGTIQDYKRTIAANESTIESMCDAVSGFTVEEIGGRKTLVLKSYVSGPCGHIDCLGYVLTYMQLGADNTWDVSHSFVLEVI